MGGHIGPLTPMVTTCTNEFLKGTDKSGSLMNSKLLPSATIESIQLHGTFQSICFRLEIHRANVYTSDTYIWHILEQCKASMVLVKSCVCVYLVTMTVQYLYIQVTTKECIRYLTLKHTPHHHKQCHNLF